MRTFVAIVLIALPALLAEYYFPWWSMAIVCFIISIVLSLKPSNAFRAGFLSISLLWLMVCLMKDFPNQHILSQKMAGVFHLPNYTLFILVTMLVGGLVGGLSAWSGSMVKKMF